MAELSFGVCRELGCLCVGVAGVVLIGISGRRWYDTTVLLVQL